KILTSLSSLKNRMSNGSSESRVTMASEWALPMIGPPVSSSWSETMEKFTSETSASAHRSAFHAASINCGTRVVSFTPHRSGDCDHDGWVEMLHSSAEDRWSTTFS